MSKNGWEEHLRNFISAASPGEAEPLSKEVLWIYAPDFNRQGVIGDIKNVTNRETSYGQLWEGLDHISTRYEALAFDPILGELTRHRALFKTAYESLDSAGKTKYQVFIGDRISVNPFESRSI